MSEKKTPTPERQRKTFDESVEVWRRPIIKWISHEMNHPDRKEYEDGDLLTQKVWSNILVRSYEKGNTVWELDEDEYVAHKLLLHYLETDREMSTNFEIEEAIGKGIYMPKLATPEVTGRGQIRVLGRSGGSSGCARAVPSPSSGTAHLCSRRKCYPYFIKE